MAIPPYSFSQLAESDIYPDHCGPLALKYATGRDDLSVLDCATALMATEHQAELRSQQQSDSQAKSGLLSLHATPGESSHRALTDLYAAMEFEDVTQPNESVANTFDRLQSEGYTHGAVLYPGHIVGFGEGVIHDLVYDPRLHNDKQAYQVWARRQAITPEASERLDFLITTGKAGGLARDHCLHQIALINNRLAEIESAPSLATQNEYYLLQTNLRRWRAYCDRGDVLGDKSVCQERADVYGREAWNARRYGYPEQAEHLEQIRDYWLAKCEDAVLPTRDLCDKRVAYLRALEEQNKAQVEEIKKLPPNKRPSLEPLFDQQAHLSLEAREWERLCADWDEYQQEPYAPAERGYFSPDMLQRREFPADNGKPGKPQRQRAKEPKATKPDAAGGGAKAQHKESRKVIAPRKPQTRKNRRVVF